MAAKKTTKRRPGRTGQVRQDPVMADVAERAGVSVMTVSRVLSGTAPVSEVTRQRVEAAIAELGYRANVAARTLAGGRSRVLGAIGVETAFYGPSQTLFGIEAAARDAGHLLSFVTLRDPDIHGLRAALDQLHDAHIEGLIVLAPIRSAIDAIATLQPDLPLVVDSAAAVSMSSVSIDQKKGARLATGHLLDAGHATVHHVGGPADWIDGDARARGWKAELKRRGCPRGRSLTGDWSPQSGYEAGRVLAADPDVTAIFAANDQMALGVLLALHEAGRRVPEDVSVVGFDDTPEAAFFNPPLTTVRQDFRELGRLSVARVLAMLAGDEQDAPDARDAHLVITPELVVRRSTAPQREL